MNYIFLLLVSIEGPCFGEKLGSVCLKVSMESRLLLSGLTSNSSTTTLQQLPSTKLQASAFGSHSLTEIRNSVSFKSWTSGSLKVSFKRVEHVKNRGKVQCGAEEPVIRKKKMAVFVSGGGSNFKSIHEACVRGSILGEIVVLVTNNPGIYFFFSFNFWTF